MTIGTIFCVMVTIHFVADWVFQSHDTAMRKSNDWIIRFEHCFLYAGFFIPFFVWVTWVRNSGWPVLTAYFLLLITHFIEDTYLPVYWWVWYVREVPSITCYRFGTDQSIKRFKEWFGTPLGCVLGIAVDQIVHILCLWAAIAALIWM